MTPNLATSCSIPELYHTALFAVLPGHIVLVQNDAPKFTIRAASPAFIKQTGLSEKVLLGNGFLEVFSSPQVNPAYTGENSFLASFLHVGTLKKPHVLPVLRYDLQDEDGSFTEKYWRISNAPLLAPDGSVAYIIHAAEDITGDIKARERAEQIKDMEQAYNLYMQAPVPIQIYKGRELIIELANASALACFGKGPEIIGQPLAEVLPEMQQQGFTKLLLEVMDTGKAKYLYDVPVTFLVNGIGQLGYFSSVYQPYFVAGHTEVAGVLVMAFDVTEKIEAKKQTEAALAEGEKQKRLYETITSNTPDLIYVVDRSFRFTYANSALLEMWGKTWEQSVGKGLRENGYNEWHARMHEREIDHVVVTRESIRGEVSFPHALLGQRIYDYIFVPVVNDEGVVEAVAGTSRDITDIRTAEEVLRKTEQQQAFLLRVNDRLRAIADPAEIQYEAARLVAEHLGADRVGYAEDGGDGTTVVVVMDYTTGVPSLKGTYYYNDYGPELLSALSTGQTVVQDDIMRDPSLSEEEKSAHVALQLGAVLNVPLLRNGYLMALFFIHFRQAHHWTEEEVSLMQQVAGRTWEAVIRARMEKCLRASEEALEKKVQERTVELEKANQELKRSNQNLEEFAYAASHDLKEPVRKIRFFTDRLKQQLKGQLTEEQDNLFGRMEIAAGRMNQLIEDLLTYSNVSSGVAQRQRVDLNGVVQNVLEDLDFQIQEKGAAVTIDPLPLINGLERQLEQLFHNLLNNGLKYSTPGVPPRLQIRCRQVYGHSITGPLKAEDQHKMFHLLEVNDNGIGFAQGDAERIFTMFTRLHGAAECKGTGVGLPIVRKVAENHDGLIWAQSSPGNGASFYILLPISESIPA